MPSQLASLAPDADVALVETIEGWIAREEIGLLLELSARVPPEQSIVEIGNYRGRSTVALALGARRGAGASVFSVDPHAEFIGPRGGRFGREDQAHLYANLARSGVGADVRVVSLGSTAVARSWDGPRVGLLFIDGDHRYDAVRADLDSWAPHLAPGARVAFDDCDFADVARLIDERLATGQLRPLGVVGKIGWFSTR